MPEVIMLAEPDAEIKGTVSQADLSELDSAHVDMAMAECFAARLGELSGKQKGYGIVDMKDGRLVKSFYDYSFGNIKEDE